MIPFKKQKLKEFSNFGEKKSRRERLTIYRVMHVANVVYVSDLVKISFRDNTIYILQIVVRGHHILINPSGKINC